MAPGQRRLAVLAAHLRGQSAPEPTAQRQHAPAGDAVPEHWRLSQMPAGPTGPRTRLIEAEKRQFYEDGFLILRQVIPRELTEAARRKWNTTPRKERGGGNGLGSTLGTQPEFLDLVMKSCIKPLLEHEMGPFSDPVGAMLAVTPPLKGEPPPVRPHELLDDGRQAWGEIGSPGLHIDGTWTGAHGLQQDEFDEATGKPYDVEKWIGEETDQNIGTNMTPLWIDEEKTLSLGSFTTFLFVPLNDQTQPGRGQTGLLRGAHNHVSRFFQKQIALGGPVGPEGPGWPRLMAQGPTDVGITSIPNEIRELFAGDGFRDPSTGVLYPKPTPCLMAEGGKCSRSLCPFFQSSTKWPHRCGDHPPRLPTRQLNQPRPGRPHERHLPHPALAPRRPERRLAPRRSRHLGPP